MHVCLRQKHVLRCHVPATTPKILSITGKSKTPWLALVAGGVTGFVALVIVDRLGGAGSTAGALHRNQHRSLGRHVGQPNANGPRMSSCRRKFPDMETPVPESAWGLTGAVIAGNRIGPEPLSASCLNPAFTLPGNLRRSSWSYAIVLAVFAAWGRHQLVLSPERKLRSERRSRINQNYGLAGIVHGAGRNS
jgi:ethanolamine permease